MNDSGDKRFGQALILFVIAFSLVLVVGAPMQSISTELGLAFTLLVPILLPAIAFVRWKGLSIRDGFRLYPVSPLVLLVTIPLALGGWGIAILFAQLLLKIGVPTLGMGISIDTLPHFLAMLAVGALLPAICEECLFRGAIQGVLERRGKWFAILLTAALFGLTHLDPLRILAATLLGVFYGWLAVRTGSLIPSMIGHFANNVLAFTSLYLLGGMSDAPSWILPSLSILFVGSLIVLHFR